MTYINKYSRVIKIILYFIHFTLLSSSLYGATRGDVKVIESSENIRYLSQKLVNDYLFWYKYPHNDLLKKSLDNTVEKLNNNFKIIARITKNSDTKDILDFLAYSKDNILDIFNSELNQENCALMLDYSEILIEGVNSIASAHSYQFAKEEKVLMLTKKMEYLLQRISKNYMAIYLNLDPTTNRQAMEKALVDFQLHLTQLNQYSYAKTNYIIKDLNRYWKQNRLLLKKTDGLFVPNLISLSLNTIEETVFKLTSFHSNNQ